MLELDMGWLVRFVERAKVVYLKGAGEGNGLVLGLLNQTGDRGVIRYSVDELGLSKVVDTARRFYGWTVTDREIAGRNVEIGEVQAMAGVGVAHLDGELEGRLGLVLDKGAREYYDFQQFEDVVVRKFEDGLYDMDEAGKCFALERYSACGFHLMRVLERGLFYAGGKLVKKHAGKTGPEDFDRTMWGIMIKEMETELDQADEGGRREVLRKVVKLVQPLKRFWRDDTMHVTQAEEWSREDAETAFVVVRHVMKYIAENV